MALPTELFTFLDDLAENNDRDWFNANKSRYRAHVQDPALSLIAAFEGPLQQISPHFLAVPKAQGGSLFRIYRDTRFSKDKSPYKTHAAIQFRHELASRDVHAPGFYLHLEPGRCMVGVGMWHPDRAALTQVRERIVAESDHWRSVKAELAAAGFDFMREDALKRAPRGFDKDHEHVEDLKLKSMAIHKPVADATVLSEDFLSELAVVYRQSAPLVAFLCEAVDLPY